MSGKTPFGRRIRKLREERRCNDPEFSLRRFAISVGISATFLSKIETGDFAPPAPDKIKKMAELLGADPDELLALAGKVDPELNAIIRDQPRAVADFLRTIREHNVSAETLNQMAEQLRNSPPDDAEEEGK